MTHAFQRAFLIWAAVLLLSVGSVLSAAMMAPDQGDVEEARIAQLGFSLAELCGSDATHEHHCPFCHLIPDTPVPGPLDVASVLVPFAPWQRAEDLYRAAQARDNARSPRAPPFIV